MSKCQGPALASASFIAGECKTFSKFFYWKIWENILITSTTEQLCKESLIDKSTCDESRFSEYSLKYTCKDSSIIRSSYKTSNCDSQPQDLTYTSPLCQDKREIRCESKFPVESKLISETKSTAFSIMYSRLTEIIVAVLGVALIFY